MQEGWAGTICSRKEVRHTKNETDSYIEDSSLKEPSPWWISHPKLRKALVIPLYMTTPGYRRWRHEKLTPRELLRMRRDLDHRLPKTRDQLIGRDKEYQLIMTGVMYYVIRDPYTRSLFKNSPPPKFFILKGTTGTGKSLLADICMRDAAQEGIERSLNVQAYSIHGSEIFNPYYGQSARNLAAIFKRATNTPSVLFFDEFQTFGLKTGRDDVWAQREDIRVQDTFINKLNKLLESDCRTIVLVATNMYENIREDLRRRGFSIDLDQNVTPEMLLAVLMAELNKNGWTYLDPREVMSTLEKAVSAYRQTQLTPFDVVDACNKVRNRKIEPIRESLFKKDEQRPDQHEYTVTIEDFKIASRELRGYVEQEKSSEVMSAVLKIRPSITYNDVGGLFSVKERIFKTISLSLRSDLAARMGWVPPKGVILWGEPGCGKTHISKAIARENDASFFYAPAAQLLINAKWIGEPEKNVKDLFSMARRAAPSIIFFDEFDIIAGKRRGDPVGDKITAQILTELDGLQPLENVMVIAATNRIEMIDEAIVNRFEPNILEIPLPKNDEERADIVNIHLRQYLPHLETEVTTEMVLAVFKRFRLVSPRVVAEVIREANRLRVQEIVAGQELANAERSTDPSRRTNAQKMYRDDLERLFGMLEDEKRLGKEPINLQSIDSSNYKIRLAHFGRAAEMLEQEADRELMDAQESLIRETPGSGVANGAGTDPQGRRGLILIVECVANPHGSGRVNVTGASKTAVLAPATTVEDVSVVESASNAAEYIREYIRRKAAVDLSRCDFTFQVISPLEGASGMGVSGPSLGLTFSVAAISQLADLPADPSVVMTGKVDIKGNVGPIGGVGWRGAGKFLAASRARRIRIKRFLIPTWNFERATDEVEVLREEGIRVIPVQRQVEAWREALNASEDDILTKLLSRIQHTTPLTPRT